MKGSPKRNSKQVETPPRVVSRDLPVRQRLPATSRPLQMYTCGHATISSHLPKSAKYALSLCLLLSYRWLKIRIFFLSNKICAQRECTSGWTLSISRQSFQNPGVPLLEPCPVIYLSIYVNSRPGVKGYMVILTFHLKLIHSPERKITVLTWRLFRFPRSCPMHAYL